MRTKVVFSALALVLSTLAAVVIASPGRAAPAKDPVILVAGLASPGFAMQPMADQLKKDGYKPYIFELPGLGLGDIVASANALTTKVAQVRAETGAAKVDLVGHSEGGLVARYYIKFLGGTTTVDSYISLGTPQYGSPLNNLGNIIDGKCLGIIACSQMAVGSSFLNNLNAGDDTPGNVRWTAIASLNDELVWPYKNAWVNDGSTNVLVQAKCVFRVVGHLGLILDGAVYTMVRSALAGGPITANCWAPGGLPL